MSDEGPSLKGFFERVHTPVHPRPALWRVCKLESVVPRHSNALPGLSGLPESLAQAICIALEEAKPGAYYIESEIEGDSEVADASTGGSST